LFELFILYFSNCEFAALQHCTVPSQTQYLLLAGQALKGIVQRKLMWVENCVNRRVMLQYWGAGHYFLILKEHYLVFCTKHFAAT
jgi:hypothetical protein